MSYSARITPRPSIASVLLEAGVIPPKVSPARARASPVPRLNLVPGSPTKSPRSPRTPGTPSTPNSFSSPSTPMSTSISLNSPLRMSFGRNPSLMARTIHSSAVPTASATMHVATASFTLPTAPAPGSPPRTKPSLHVTVPEEEPQTVFAHPFPPPHPVEPIRLMSVAARKERRLYTPPIIRQAYDAAILTMTPIVPASPRGARTPSPYPSGILQPSPVMPMPMLASPMSPYSPGSAYSFTPTTAGFSDLTDLPSALGSGLTDFPTSAVGGSPKPVSNRSIQFLDSPHPRYSDAPGGLKPDGPPSALGRGRPRPRRPRALSVVPGVGVTPNLLSPIPPPEPSLSPAPSPGPVPSPLSLGPADSTSSLPFMSALSPGGLSPGYLSPGALSPRAAPSPTTLTVTMMGLPAHRSGLASPGHLSPSYIPRFPSPLHITTAGLSPRLAPVNLPNNISLLRLSPSMTPMSPLVHSPMMLTPLQIRQALGPVAHVWGVIYWVWAYYGGWNPLSSMPAARAFSAIQADPASD